METPGEFEAGEMDTLGELEAGKTDTLGEFEAAARARLDPAHYDYFAGGAGDEVTLRANEAAFDRLALVPRVLRGAGKLQLGVTLLGSRAAMPVLVAPTAFHRLADPEGERATARAAATAETIMIVCMASTVAVEDVAAAAPEATLWFQLYIQPDLAFTETLVRRAEAAGLHGAGRHGGLPHPGGAAPGPAQRLPRPARGPVLREPARRRAGAADRHVTGDLLGAHRPAQGDDGAADRAQGRRASRRRTPRARARRLGAPGLQHGGRQLDTVPAAVDLLPDIVAAVGGTVPVLLDGGVRRGTDVLKALALGATAVAVGRPVIWGLAADGERGAGRVLSLLRTEVERALTLCGCASIDELEPGMVRRPW